MQMQMDWSYNIPEKVKCTFKVTQTIQHSVHAYWLDNCITMNNTTDILLRNLVFQLDAQFLY